MNLFTINQEKCNRCGICAVECPARIIKYKDKNTYPELFAGSAEFCIKCGHCVAICPTGSFTHRNLKPEDCIKINKELIISQEQAGLFLRSRRSIRVYQDTPVEQKKLEQLIETASYAPTAKNLQHVQWVVIYNKNQVKRLGSMVIEWMRDLLRKNPELARVSKYDVLVAQWDSGVDRIFRGAPHVIVAHAPAGPYTLEDCSGALAYLELAAYSMGLGSCWAGYFTAATNFYQPLQEALALPPGHSCFGAVMVGYPKYRYQRVPLRNKPVIDWR